MITISVETVTDLLTKAERVAVEIESDSDGADGMDVPDLASDEAELQLAEASEQTEEPEEGTEPIPSTTLENNVSYCALKEALAVLDGAEIDDLLALALIGHGDFGKDEWQDALVRTRSIPDPEARALLLQAIVLTDDLEDGLVQMGYSAIPVGMAER